MSGALLGMSKALIWFLADIDIYIYVMLNINH